MIVRYIFAGNMPQPCEHSGQDTLIFTMSVLRLSLKELIWPCPLHLYHGARQKNIFWLLRRRAMGSNHVYRDSGPNLLTMTHARETAAYSNRMPVLYLIVHKIFKLENTPRILSKLHTSRDFTIVP